MKDTEKKRILHLLESFSSSDIIPVLPTIKENGNAEFIIPMAKVLVHTDDELVKKQIQQIFMELKHNAVVPEIMKIIEDSTFSKEASFFRSLCWGLQLDFSEYFDTFINLFIESPFEAAFDYFTTIELLMQNYAENISEEQTNNAVKAIKNAISKIDDSKKELAVECVHLLETHKKN